MRWLENELLLIFRSRLSVFAIIFLTAISSLSVYLGVKEIKKQQDTIFQLISTNNEIEKDTANSAEKMNQDAGSIAYYTYYNTWDNPSNTAFAALGLRDVAPYISRIRALGLQAQLYDGEVFNPELALPGRFDFAFVLIYLAPLFVIALLHDLVTSEKQSGRLTLLMSLPKFGKKRWIQRTLIRYILILTALILPFIIGSLSSGIYLVDFLKFILIIICYLAFWVGVSLLIATRNWTSLTNATTLVGVWVIFTLILPTLSNLILIRTIPVSQGVDLMLTQRQNVHSAWEIPRERTMQQFFETHPEWKNTAPLPEAFHWKWYFAFHQLGDESVNGLFEDYRSSLSERQKWTNRIGWILPSVAAQNTLHGIANTDLSAQLDYQDRMIAFHDQIRKFYYNFLFNDIPFTADDWAKQPQYQLIDAEIEPRQKANILSLILLSLIIFVLGLCSIRGKYLK